MPRHRLPAIILLLAGCAAHAQQTGVQLGSVTVFPTLGLSVGYDDNVALSPADPVSSFFYRVSPAVRLQTSTRRADLLLEAGADIGRFTDSPADDYEDYGVSGLWSWRPTLRQAFAAAAAYQRGHNRRGEGLQEFLPGQGLGSVDRFERRDVDLSYRFGADSARGRIELDAGWSDLEYLNNREFTAIADYRATRLGAGFTARVAPKTSLLLFARTADYRYREGTRDNRDDFLGLGATWLATAKTSGRFEVGYREKDFQDSGDDFSGVSWLAKLDWRPREYSVVELSTARTPDAAFGAGQYIVRDSVELAWRHQWRGRIATVVDLAVGDESIEPEGRDDDLIRAGVSVSYQFRRFLLLGAGIKRVERDSTDPQFDFVRNEMIVTAELLF